MIYAYVVAGVIFLALSTATAVQTKRLATCQEEFATFKGGVAALGVAAAAAAKKKEAMDKIVKEKVDAENKTAVSSLRATVKRLRDANASASRLPPAAPTSSRPDLACFDRAEYQRADGVAIEKLFAGARGLADEGTAATVDLDTAKAWALRL